MSRRDSILEAISEANRLHHLVKSQQDVQVAGGGIDVFGAITHLGIPLIFRPLDKLLGAYITNPSRGIIVTTQRGLAIQRFTACHELGHAFLGHKGSLDDFSILNRSLLSTARFNDIEAAADAFAASFLMPKWLIEFQAERHKWNADSFGDPHVVYQLSLRVGASYEATCRSLERYRVIGKDTLNRHLSVEPKDIKQDLLGGRKMPNWYMDVWDLTDQDQGALIQGGPQDVFLIRLKQNSGAGYLWEIDELSEAGFNVVSDEVLITDPPEETGGSVERILLAISEFEAEGILDLEQKRPWEVSPSNVLHFILKYELLGKENGLPRSLRERVVAA